MDEIIRISDTLDYRGYHIDFYYDDYGQSFYTFFENEEISFGSFNSNYKEEMEYLIDKKLDSICWFEEFPGAKLEWFFNGLSGARDIRLLYKTRLLKVFLVADPESVNTENLKKQSLEILSKVCN